MLRPVLPAVRPFRSGAICLFLAVTLGAVGRDARRRPGGRAARTGGTRSGSRPAAAWWGRRFDWGRDDARGHVGAHILAIFLFIAGVLLLTGASVAGVIKSTSDSVSSTTRELRTAAAKRRAAAARDATTWRRSSAPRACASSGADGEIEEPPEYDAPGTRRRGRLDRADRFASPSPSR